MNAVIDVHAHAVPMPVLRWLADRGLADLAGVGDGVVVLDPRVSGVGPGAALPLARSMYAAPVRLEEMASTGVTHEAISLPPFLFGSTCDDGALVGELVGRGNDALRDYCTEQPDRLFGLGALPMGWAGRPRRPGGASTTSGSRVLRSVAAAAAMTSTHQ